MALEKARILDQSDPLAAKRALFSIPHDTIYLDGNSLGVMSHAVNERVADVTRRQWGKDLITSWNKHGWIDLPITVGDRIGKLIGAAPGQVICCDSISINLFKVLCAALQIQSGRTQFVSTEDNFPTDLYMIQGVERLLGDRCSLTTVAEDDLIASITEETAAVVVTEVNFRTGRRLDLAKITAQAHDKGALVIVDLAHSAGAMPVTLDALGIDFAVGCTYKYLNAGPGAPAFVYVAKKWLSSDFAGALQPLFGWLGHAEPFAFSPQYTGASGIRQFLVGTPPIISLSAVDAALDAFEDVSMEAIREKSLQLMEFWLSCMGDHGLLTIMPCVSPTEGTIRGSQLSFAHDDAYAICQALIARGVVADFRAPNYLRFGFAPLYNTYEDVARAVARLSEIVYSGAYQDKAFQSRAAVT